VVRDVTVPLIRFGLVSSWLLCFMIFVREYSTGVYLQGPGTEVLGALIVSLFGGGSLELVAALSVVNVALVAAGLVRALRLGVRLLASVPFPTFVSSRSTRFYERRKRRDTSKS